MSYKKMTISLLAEMVVYHKGKRYSLKFGCASCQFCEFINERKACEEFGSDMWCNQFIFQEYLTLSEKLDKL